MYKAIHIEPYLNDVRIDLIEPNRQLISVTTDTLAQEATIYTT